MIGLCFVYVYEAVINLAEEIATKRKWSPPQDMN